jgi:hypothetical protein
MSITTIPQSEANTMNFTPNPILNTNFIVEVQHSVVGDFLHLTFIQSNKDSNSDYTIELELPSFVLEDSSGDKINDLITRLNGNITVNFRNQFISFKGLKDLLLGCIVTATTEYEKKANYKPLPTQSSQDINPSQHAVRLT